MSKEIDGFGFAIDPAERMQQVMLSLHDLLDESNMAGFPEELVGQLDLVRRKYLDEFERRFPGYGSGRAIWR